MREALKKKILLAAGIFFLLVFCLLPFFFMAAVSFSRHPGFLAPGIAWSPTLSNYLAIFSNPDLHFEAYLVNSALVSFLSAVLSVFIASLAAYALTRLEWTGRGFVLIFVLAVSMFPQISLAGYLFKLMVRLGWINTHQALILPYTGWILPLSLWILVSYFARIPRELDRAALIDGCSHWQILWKVLFPVALPGLFSTALLAFIAAFNEFMFALILTTDYHARTLPVGLALFQGVHGQVPWGEIMAASVLTIIPVVAMTLLFQRHMVQGLTQGAVKE